MTPSLHADEQWAIKALTTETLIGPQQAGFSPDSSGSVPKPTMQSLFIAHTCPGVHTLQLQDWKFTRLKQFKLTKQRKFKQLNSNSKCISWTQGAANTIHIACFTQNPVSWQQLHSNNKSSHKQITLSWSSPRLSQTRPWQKEDAHKCQKRIYFKWNKQGKNLN